MHRCAQKQNREGFFSFVQRREIVCVHTYAAALRFYMTDHKHLYVSINLNRKDTSISIETSVKWYTV